LVPTGPTITATQAAGTSSYGPVYAFAARTAPVPAGWEAVGFSVSLANYNYNTDSASCELVDANHTGTVLATAGSQTLPWMPTFATFASTQIVDLTAATSLMVQCTTDPSNTGPFLAIQYLSIYATPVIP
jgi:hypothetical protein